MWLIILLLTMTSLIIWDYLFKRHRNRLINAAGIMGPKPTLPLIGDAFHYIRNDTKMFFNIIEDLSLEFGKVIRLWLGHRLFLIVKDPVYFQAILTRKDTLKKSFVYQLFFNLLGDSILLSVGSKWHKRRKIITPTFHFKILEEFLEVFDRQSGVLANKLYDRADGELVIDIYPMISLMAFDGITETAMGVKINAQDNPDMPYLKALTDTTDILAQRVIQPLHYNTLAFMLTAFSSYLKLNKSIKILHNFTDKVISERKAALKNDNMTSISKNNISSDVGEKKRMAFLDVLLEAEIDGKPLKYQELREEVMTFMIGGHDTTTSAISFCLYLLARHADIQQKLFQEIIQVIGHDKDKPVTMRDLQQLKYLELVIKESLRLYPSLPFIGRHIETDVQVDDKIIPANTNVILLFYHAARDPDIFAKPHDFIPERYNSEELNSVNTFANIPFSAGIRNCIGQKYAMLQMKNVISKMLRHFELLPLGPAVEPVLNIVLRSSTGMNLGLKPRKY